MLADKITNWMKQKVTAAQKDGIVVGLSGGVDSASVAVLAKRAFGERVLALIMPCHSNPADW